jgi:hypothetical protein
MPDSGLGEARTVLRLSIVPTLLGLSLLPPACFATDVAVTMFGPKQYLTSTRRRPTLPRPRTEDKVLYFDSFRGVQGKGAITIQNGDGGGNNLVTDAVVFFNGLSIFDSSMMSQPGSTLQVPISMNDNNWVWVRLSGAPGSYLTIQAAAEITPDATTAQVVGMGGGAVSVQNHLGDTFTLTIPPLALDQDTSISVSALPKALPSPIAKNLYPGVVLEPSGLVFSLPATVTVTLHQALDPGAMLFSFENSGFVLPTANQALATAKNSIQGQIYHFSPPLEADDPTEEELSSTETEIEEAYPPSSVGTVAPTCFNPDVYCFQVANWIDAVDGLLSIANSDNVSPQAAAGAQANAGTILREAVVGLLAQPMLGDPCGLNSVATGELVAAVLSLLKDSGLASQLAARECLLTVSPPSVALSLGQTWNQAITATLTDPNDNERSCSTTTWDSSKTSVVTVAPSGMSCVPTGVAMGVSSVSANCDGLPSSNQTAVTVCSLSGTWQGSYSGETISCAERGPDGGCIEWGGLKESSGTVSISFTQSGGNVTADLVGYTFTGTDVNGAVSLSAMLPCNAGTSSCPAQITGTLAPDCSTFSGNFYYDRPRTATGTFTLYPPAAQ